MLFVHCFSLEVGSLYSGEFWGHPHQEGMSPDRLKVQPRLRSISENEVLKWSLCCGTLHHIPPAATVLVASSAIGCAGSPPSLASAGLLETDLGE